MTRTGSGAARPSKGAAGASRACALVLALTGAALGAGSGSAVADSGACTHDFSGPQVCVRLSGQGPTNAVTGIWTNPPTDTPAREVFRFLDGRPVSSALATRSGRALVHTWPRGNLGNGTRVCVRFRGSGRAACQTTG